MGGHQPRMRNAKLARHQYHFPPCPRSCAQIERIWALNTTGNSAPSLRNATFRIMLRTDSKSTGCIFIPQRNKVLIVRLGGLYLG